MQLIIDGGTKETRENYIHDKFPVKQTSYLELVKEDGKATISVENTRLLLKKLDTSTSINRVIWIHEANDLTPASQNTLLKSLEEPARSTSFVLSLDNYRTLLPTIISRCKLIHLEKVTGEVSTALLSELKNLMKSGLATRLNYLTSLGKDRETIIEWLSQVLSSIELTLKTTNSQKGREILGKLARLTFKARKSLKSNGNTTLVMGNFLLSLPKTK